MAVKILKHWHCTNLIELLNNTIKIPSLSWSEATLKKYLIFSLPKIHVVPDGGKFSCFGALLKYNLRFSIGPIGYKNDLKCAVKVGVNVTWQQGLFKFDHVASKLHFF